MSHVHLPKILVRVAAEEVAAAAAVGVDQHPDQDQPTSIPQSV